MEPRSLEDVIRNIDTRLERVEQILPTLATKAELSPLATKEELAAAIAPLATKAELAAAIAPLATKAELAAAIAPLATKAELAEEGERTRRHFDVVAERLEGHIQLLAEGQVALRESMERQFTEVRGDIAQLDRRVIRLEAGRRV